MSVLDLSSLISLHTPEMLAPPPAPATPEIDATEMQASDANSSGASFNSDTQSGASVGDQAAASGRSASPRGRRARTRRRSTRPRRWCSSSAVASLINVENLEQSIPPSMAAARGPAEQITASGVIPSEAAMGSLYTIIDSAAALALTAV